MKIYRYNILVCLVAVLMVVGCNTSKNDVKEERTPFLIEDTICDNWECWDEIYPGQTTIAEAQGILEDKYGEQNLEINSQFGNISWESFNQSDDYQFIWVTSLNTGIVDRVYITLPNNKLTIEALISQIGEPSQVLVSRWNCSGISVLYPSRGIVITVFSDNSFVGINATQFVSSILFMPLEMAQNYSVTDTLFVEWQGYMDYCQFIKN